VMDLALEDIRALENGDYLAKVVYTLRRGAQESKLAARLTLTELEGEWRLINREQLD